MARKAMIIGGLIPDDDGMWKIAQLSEELQAIVDENRFCHQSQDTDR